MLSQIFSWRSSWAFCTLHRLLWANRMCWKESQGRSISVYLVLSFWISCPLEAGEGSVHVTAGHGDDVFSLLHWARAVHHVILRIYYMTHWSPLEKIIPVTYRYCDHYDKYVKSQHSTFQDGIETLNVWTLHGQNWVDTKISVFKIKWANEWSVYLCDFKRLELSFIRKIEKCFPHWPIWSKTQSDQGDSICCWMCCDRTSNPQGRDSYPSKARGHDPQRILKERKYMIKVSIFTSV